MTASSDARFIVAADLRSFLSRTVSIPRAGGRGPFVSTIVAVSGSHLVTTVSGIPGVGPNLLAGEMKKIDPSRSARRSPIGIRLCRVDLSRGIADKLHRALP